jgi:hypothetical protein
MVNRPSVPEIITVNSEELQTLIRDLLPSQNGFGSELQASNVITPIIDLTATAEGSTLRSDLQTALAYGNQTAFNVENTTTNLANSPGFYQITGTSVVVSRTATTGCSFLIDDGLAAKQIWGHSAPGVSTTGSSSAVTFNITVFLTAGDTLQAKSDNSDALIEGSFRQVATGDGTLVNPTGYPL